VDLGKSAVGIQRPIVTLCHLFLKVISRQVGLNAREKRKDDLGLVFLESQGEQATAKSHL
jgi:hypothetical protein